MEKVTVSMSRKVSDQNYGSFQANIGLEDEVPKGTDRDSHAASLRAWCKAFLDETLGDMKDAYMALEDFQSSSEEFAEEVGGVVVAKAIEGEARLPAEEPPPLPTETITTTERRDMGEEKPAPSPSDNDYRKTFRIQSFEVAKTEGGDKYLRCYGKAPWKRAWVPAWNDVADLLFGDIEDLDLGVLGPPYTLDAVVQMKDDEWKGKKYIAPDKVIEWEQVR